MKQITKKLKLCILFAAAFLFLGFMPAKVEAANYQVVNISVGTDGQRTKVGSYYFWGAFKSGGYKIYSSKSKTAKTGTTVATVSLLDSAYSIVTNGSVVYYTTASSNTKHVVYRVSATGKSRKKLATISANRIVLEKVYNNQLYYARYTSSGRSFCSLSTSTKKTKTIVKNCNDGIYSITGGRYIYAATSSSTKTTIRVFDCQKAKVIKTLSLQKKSSAYATLYVSKKYFYCVISTPNSDLTSTDKVYRYALNGSGKAKLIATMKSVDSIGGVTDSYIYYYTGKTNTTTGEYKVTYYKYKISTKKSTKISESAYYKAIAY